MDFNDNMVKQVVFIDLEVSREDLKILDIGAVRNDGTPFHSPSLQSFRSFISNSIFLCGHNIVRHDLKHLQASDLNLSGFKVIDTLCLSPLLSPKRPYHKLLKNDKLQTEELNNPVNDCKKAADLFYDEINVFKALPVEVKDIYYGLLCRQPEFSGFFEYVDFKPRNSNILDLINDYYDGKICAHADVLMLTQNHPVELAYALALIDTDDPFSISPPWLLYNYPEIENLVKTLRNTPCEEGCAYCENSLNVLRGLKQIFGFDEFRLYDGEPLQEKAAQAAVEGKSLLAIFPTGGGKSVTFQLPALMAGKTVHGLTVVISPLQSLMKDQVDHLNELGIAEAVAISGLLDPIERANVLERVANGSATILYISPEQLRSRTIEKLLLSRSIVRFVIDEAHCFSAWGQDFRVDYLYIGKFIRKLQENKHDVTSIPVSCFTATAKQKVVSDICDYFRKELDLNLEIFASSASRTNLRYHVLFKETDKDKYLALRNLIAQEDCPTIVYVSRTRSSLKIAEKLTKDGFPAKPFNGQMETNDKIANQEAFIRNEVKIIVATSAFGMGVDKKDVKLVVHYDISGSLEDYVQEAGLAGRDPSIQAKCYVLYNDNDLNKHFMLHSQSKLSFSEIQQIWKAIKDLTKGRSRLVCSPLELARQAGWDDSSTRDVETRVKTAISALEKGEYVRREKNVPRIFATSLQVNNMYDASSRIERSTLITEDQRLNASRIVKSLISSKSRSNDPMGTAESRVDYLADMLGIKLGKVIDLVNLMRQDGILADTLDMSANILVGDDTDRKSRNILDRFNRLENFLLNQLNDESTDINYKKLNELALTTIPDSNVKNIRTLVYYHVISGNFQNPDYSTKDFIRIVPIIKISKLIEKSRKRLSLCSFIIRTLYMKVEKTDHNNEEIKEEKPVNFSLITLLNEYNSSSPNNLSKTSLSELENALLFLSKIGALKIEGGFLVTYNGLEINRLITDNKRKYRMEDYRFLDEYYQQKIRQIHIVGEFANLMVRNYEAALQFVYDYFQIDFKKFIAKYFKGDRAKEIDRNITPQKYHELYDALSEIQSQIIDDSKHKYIVVAAGPGSGKTRTLVHKLASLLQLENVKHEQLLMLTFSRVAATEFKKRLYNLVGSVASFVDVKTFHSYCFDLVGKAGRIEGCENVVKEATELINSGEVEPGKISKTALVIDESQDMDENEFNLVNALIQNNDDMRLIAVGDDDQNIYEIRGSSSKYFKSLIEKYGAVKYEMVENYRSKSNIVEFANQFATLIHDRMKTTPIQSVREGKGIVSITRHYGSHMEEAIVRHLLETRGNSKCCIMTRTNQEALQVFALLSKHKIRARLTQPLDDNPKSKSRSKSRSELRLSDLAEIRFFMKILNKDADSPAISEEDWNAAKERLFQTYSNSSCLSNCKNLIYDFEKVNVKKYSSEKDDLISEDVDNFEIYKSDLEEFINRSSYEDFYDDDNEAVYVSTIHKTKGREFDIVYMMLNGIEKLSEETKRIIYVGITRAKDALYIHCNTDIFSQIKIPEATHLNDITLYPEPTEIALYLTHSDVYLDYSIRKKEKILMDLRLRSGMELFYCPCRSYLNKSQERIILSTAVGNTYEEVVALSKECTQRIRDYEKKGYSLFRAEIRFIVAWKKQGQDQEYAVILPNVYLKKQGSSNK